jgi:hypothetical protein
LNYTISTKLNINKKMRSRKWYPSIFFSFQVKKNFKKLKELKNTKEHFTFFKILPQSKEKNSVSKRALKSSLKLSLLSLCFL